MATFKNLIKGGISGLVYGMGEIVLTLAVFEEQEKQLREILENPSTKSGCSPVYFLEVVPADIFKNEVNDGKA